MSSVSSSSVDDDADGGDGGGESNSELDITIDVPSQRHTERIQGSERGEETRRVFRVLPLTRKPADSGYVIVPYPRSGSLR